MFNFQVGEQPENINIGNNIFKECNQLKRIIIKGRLTPYNLNQILSSCPGSLEVLDISDCEIMDIDKNEILGRLERFLKQRQNNISIISIRTIIRSMSH